MEAIFLTFETLFRLLLFHMEIVKNKLSKVGVTAKFVLLTTQCIKLN
jgi:hypothetical protein